MHSCQHMIPSLRLPNTISAADSLPFVDGGESFSHGEPTHFLPHPVHRRQQRDFA